MTIQFQRASLDDKLILRNLLELCQHDSSEFTGEDVDEHGQFGYRYLDHYWTEAGRHPFLIRVAGRLAGFVLVRALESQGEITASAIAEFFVVRKYRRQGIGRQAAVATFELFPGKWSIYQEEANLPAQSFWRRVVAEYTHGAYTEEHLDSEEWRGPCQRFQNSPLKA